MKKIKLTKGKYAIVDDEDYEYLNRFKWYTAYFEGYWSIQRVIRNGNERTFVKIDNFILPDKPHQKIIHKNGDNLDCRKENLVYTTYQCIKQRARKAKGKTSKYKGVSYDKKCTIHPWRAGIEKQINGKRTFTRMQFVNERTAAIWYNKKAKELFGKFAYQNKI